MKAQVLPRLLLHCTFRPCTPISITSFEKAPARHPLRSTHHLPPQLPRVNSTSHHDRAQLPDPILSSLLLCTYSVCSACALHPLPPPHLSSFHLLLHVLSSTTKRERKCLQSHTFRGAPRLRAGAGAGASGLRGTSFEVLDVEVTW